MAEENKEQKQSWTTYLAITTVLIAVCATVSTFKGGGFSTRSLMNQTKASDQWAFFQSKSIKEYLFEMQKDNLEMEYKSMLDEKEGSEKLLEVYRAEIENCSQKIKKYEKEKEEIIKEAKSFEKIRDDSKIHSESFGIAVIFLQVSILLSSISALTKKKYIWLLSLFVAIFGIIYFANGFLLFM